MTLTHDPNEKKATSHYEIEDVPNMNEPETALDMWRSQMSGLVPLEQVAQEVNDAERILTKAHKFAEKKGILPLKADVEAVWQKMVALHETVTRYDATLTGAGVAIEAIDAQRREALGEMEAVILAMRRHSSYYADQMKHGKITADDALNNLVEAVIEEEREFIEEGALEFAFESEAENVMYWWREYLTTHCGEEGAALAYQTSWKFFDLMKGDATITPPIAEAMLGLARALQGVRDE